MQLYKMSGLRNRGKHSRQSRWNHSIRCTCSTFSFQLSSWSWFSIDTITIREEERERDSRTKHHLVQKYIEAFPWVMNELWSCLSFGREVRTHNYDRIIDQRDKRARSLLSFTLLYSLERTHMPQPLSKDQITHRVFHSLFHYKHLIM